MGGFFVEKMITTVESQPRLAEYPGTLTAYADGITVGRTILPETPLQTWSPNTTFLRFYNALNGKSEKEAKLRRNIVFSLNNNSPSETVPIAHERALSAYFTYNPSDRTVILEWGMIDTKGDAKLHTYLNQAINFQVRVAEGMQLSSGHLAKISGEETYLAYLDRIGNSVQYAENEPIARMINTLHSNNFIPLTAEGFVQIPFF